MKKEHIRQAGMSKGPKVGKQSKHSQRGPNVARVLGVPMPTHMDGRRQGGCMKLQMGTGGPTEGMEQGERT